MQSLKLGSLATGAMATLTVAGCGGAVRGDTGAAPAVAVDNGGAVDVGAVPNAATAAVVASAMATAAEETSTATATAAQMVLKSITGPVVSAEIASFKAHIAALVPAANNLSGAWTHGSSGVQLKAMGMVYQISRDIVILQKMISFCDALLAERNDLAAPPVGQNTAWTGTIAPVWPHAAGTVASAGAEQGDAIGHLAYCARLILRTPGLAHRLIPAGDAHGFGQTYLERAKRYVRAADQTARDFVLDHLLALDSNGLYRFSASSPYKTGESVPWNQQMMLNYGFMNLSDAHNLLADNVTLEKQYRHIVSTNIASFFDIGITSYKASTGRAAYNWGHALPDVTGEDSRHGALDIAGLYRTYDKGGYKISTAHMDTLANTFVDVMMLGPDHYAGKVDGTSGTGHAAGTRGIRSAYLLLSQFRTDAYSKMVSAAIAPGVGTSSIDVFANVLWLKAKRSGATILQ